MGSFTNMAQYTRCGLLEMIIEKEIFFIKNERVFGIFHVGTCYVSASCRKKSYREFLRSKEILR